mmetsp:Transcript_5224/g.6165  ORF Transcript_5224/g.6165 Transcript_5224/m.6165 type:complete len:437 (+) Transcript_5224:1772-3082(+)
MMLYYSNELNMQQILVEKQHILIDTLELTYAEEHPLVRAEYVIIEVLSQRYLYYLTTLIVLSVASTSYFIRDLEAILYSYLRKIKVSFKIEMLMNMITVIVLTYWMVKYYGEYTQNINARHETQVFIIIDRMTHDSTFNIKITVALLNGIQFTRILIAIKSHRILGPMIKTISSMFYDLIVFIVIYLTVFFIFATTGLLMFSELPIYMTFINSCKTLFSSSLGGFNFSDYDDLQKIHPNVGYIFLTVYLTISALMLLNLLIAIFSETYTLLSGKKMGLYVKEIVMLRRNFDFHPSYSSIVYTPIPLNLATCLLAPTTILMNSPRFNEAVLYVVYLPVAAFAVSLFIACTALVTPVSYVLLVWMKLKFVFEQPVYSANDRCARMLDFLLFCVFGVPMLVGVGLVDTVKFAVGLYSSNLVPQSSSTNADDCTAQLDRF